MRAKYFLCAAGLAVLLSSGCAGQQTQMEFIGAEEAKRLALTDAGLSVSDVEFTAADLANRSGVDYYQVDFTASGQNYKYDIDALTGAVIDASIPDSIRHEDTAEGSKDKKEDAQAAQQNGTPEFREQEKNGGSILTSGEAKEKALEHAGLSATDVTFTKCGLDYEHGRKVYEVEFYSGDGREYDYDIDASNGEVISFDYDTESYTPPAGSNKMLTEQKAKELALAQVPGAAASDIREFETDYDDGRTEYEGKIIYNGMEYEFEIDAYSGAIRSWDAEPLD